ncbi:Fc.00g040760.m01.CDS01 [Cosmosporella sp. VM-42]
MRPGRVRLYRLAAEHFRPGARTPWARRCMSSPPGDPPPMLLEHRHVIGDGPGGLREYDDVEAIQENLRAKLLAWKSLPDSQRSQILTPRPQLLSFESTPTFTLGRRQDALTPLQTSRLRSPLTVALPHRRESISQSFIPKVRKTNRGGLTTYHGPGQLVLWPVLDMHSPLYGRYSVMTYASHLESTTQRLLSSLFGIATYTSRDEPGVWVTDPSGGAPRKIAALGVHHRRHVTALGIAVNIDIPVTGGEGVNPWARFVPCGLDGKLVTSVVAEHREIGEWDMGTLAGRWARIFEEGLRDGKKRRVGGDADVSFRRAS